MEIKNLKPRKYQEKILETSKDKNTLVVLPTGLGKTAISLLLSIERLNKYPNSKVIICSPSKPLASQHLKTFKEHTNIKEISLLTGAMPPKKRKILYGMSKIITATPQTIESDLKNNRISLENVSLLTIDEAHRSKERYANTIISKNYMENSKFPRILALTASPGSSKENIDKICKNLYIEAVEIRTVDDEDVKVYIKEKEINWINVELPEEFKEITRILKNIYTSQLNSIKKFGFTKPLYAINKRDLLDLQKRLQQEIKRGNRYAYSGTSLVAKMIKLNHAVELLETQGLKSFKEYINKLKRETSKAAKSIMNDNEFKKALELSRKIKINHPKINELCKEVKKHLEENKDSRIIIFANYRNMVKEIVLELKNLKDTRPIELVGQKEGLSQKEQVKRIEEFSKGKYNILTGTSISEEGLDIANADHAIFYEPTPSEIRDIQRRGRVGRLTKGKITILLTKNTKDEAYYWTAKKKEQKMKSTLYKMQDEQNTLKNY